MKTLIDHPFIFVTLVLGITVITTVVLTAIVAAWWYSLITGVFAAITGSIVLIAFIVAECLVFNRAMK